MTSSQWHTLLDASPGDPELRYAYAAWLQDECDDVEGAEFQRWLGERRRWPRETLWECVHQEERWRWYVANNRPSSLDGTGFGHYALESWFMPTMKHGLNYASTRQGAESVAFTAWQAWQTSLPAGERWHSKVLKEATP